MGFGILKALHLKYPALERCKHENIKTRWSRNRVGGGVVGGRGWVGVGGVGGGGGGGG